MTPQKLAALLKKSFSPISLLGARFKSSKYWSLYHARYWLRWQLRFQTSRPPRPWTKIRFLKRLPGCIVVFLALFVLVANGFSQEDMRFVDNSVFVKPARPAVLFDHDTHNEKSDIEDCSSCHHLYENGKLLEDESSEDQSCSDCHGRKDTGNTVSLRKAFHLNCKGCHLENNAGPIMCGQCHQTKPKTGS
jgi:hypothetical protein